MTNLQLAKELIESKTGPDGKCTLSKKKLGEILHNNFPANFKDAEAGRLAIRAVTGARGDAFRKKIKTRIEWKGLSLPQPERNDFSRHVIRTSRIGILGDIHIPYYHRWLNVAIAWLISWKPETILLNGDIIDCYQASDHERDPRARKLGEEIKMVCKFLNQLIELFPQTEIIWKLGNHEERYERQIVKRLPEYAELDVTKFEVAIQYQYQKLFKKDLKVTFVKNKRIVRAGKLEIIHGHELARGLTDPVNPARGFYNKAKNNVIGGHHHRSSDHMESDIKGNLIGCWSVGCLCDLHPAYMPVNKWNLGFAVVEVQPSGGFAVRNLKIINGKVL